MSGIRYKKKRTKGLSNSRALSKLGKRKAVQEEDFGRYVMKEGEVEKNVEMRQEQEINYNS